MPTGPRQKLKKRTEAQWESLSEAQRNRYLRAGRTGTLNGRKNLTEAQVRNYYLSGKSLVAARRGAKSKEAVAQRAKKAGAKKLSRDAVLQAEMGMLTDSTDKLIATWRGSELFPDWLPQSKALMGDDVAAILASIGVPPERWESVRFIFEADGSVTMIVQPKGANQYGKAKPRMVRLPDAQAAAETGRWLQSTNYDGMRIDRTGYESPGPAGRIAA